MMPDRLFVYGTLKPGESMSHLLESIGGTWQKAKIRGEFKQAGSIPGFNYPVLILNGNAEDVEGYLFTSENLSDNWDKIDRYEGNQYRRVKADVILEDGEMVEAFVYEYIS